MKMKTILLLAPLLSLLAGCSSARQEPPSTVTKDSRGNLVIQQDQRREEYRGSGIPPFHYYNPVTQQNDWEKYQTPRSNIQK